MFKWIKALRRRCEPEAAGGPRDEERDSGEEEYEAHEEEAREAAPDGMTRMKTDKI